MDQKKAVHSKSLHGVSIHRFVGGFALWMRGSYIERYNAI